MEIVMKKTVRTIGELALYVLAVFALAILLSTLLKLITGPSEGRPEWIRFFVTGTLLLISVTVVHIIMRRRGHSQFSDDGWFRGLANLKPLAVGMLFGLAMILLAELLLLISGTGHFVRIDGGLGDYLGMFFPILISFSLLAFAEEALFRGYPFAKLTSLVGPVWTNVILSLLFAAGHLSNPGVSLLVPINIFLGSLVIGAVRGSKWGLPAAGGFHAAWNVTQVMLGATVSGVVSPMPAIRLVTDGPALLTGGEFGPEGSLWATFATLGFLIFLLRAPSQWKTRRALPRIPGLPRPDVS